MCWVVFQEEISSVKGRMEFIMVASNERQKELESMWSTVMNLDESIQSLLVQIKQQDREIELLMEEEEPKNLSRRVKVRHVFHPPEKVQAKTIPKLETSQTPLISFQCDFGVKNSLNVGKCKRLACNHHVVDTHRNRPFGRRFACCRCYTFY